MTNWKILLKALGFSESEVIVYLSSLELGPASVQDLAKKAKVSRVTTYAVIESLASQGLMSSVEKGKKRLFVAEAPERLLSFSHSRVQQMSATLKEVESSLHDLRLLQQGEKPVVKLFEGIEALKAVQDDVLRTRPKEMAEFGNIDDVRRLYSADELNTYGQELATFKPKVRSVLLSKTHEAKNPNPNADILNLLKESFDFHGDVTVYANKVVLSTYSRKQISVLIESSEIADTVRGMFDLIWKLKEQVKKLEK